MKLADAPISASHEHALGVCFGKLEGITDGILSGWAVALTSEPHKPAIEILADGFVIGLCRADVYRRDLVADLDGDGCFGFLYRLPLSLLTCRARLSARFANTAIPLDNTLQLPLPDSRLPASQQAGYVVADTGLALSGWCWLGASSETASHIEVYENGECICTQALHFIPPTQIGHQAPDHDLGGVTTGFMLHLPMMLADGKVHSLQVKTDQGVELQGSPVNICAIIEGVAAFAHQAVNTNTVTIKDTARTDHTAANKNTKPEKQNSAAHVSNVTPIRQIIDTLSFRLPAAVDFTDYATWFEAFGAAPPTKPHKQTRTKQCIVALYGQGDLQITLRSLQQQTTWPLLLCVVDGDPIQIQAVIKQLSIPRGQWQVVTQDHVVQLKTTTAQQAWLVPLRWGDQLLPNALGLFAEQLWVSGADMVYADIDRGARDGTPTSPWFKPDWDLDLFLAGHLLSQGLAFKLSLLKPEAAQTSKLVDWAAHAVARMLEQPPIKNVPKISHLPYVLYRSQVSPAEPISAEALTQCLQAIAPKARLDTNTRKTPYGYRVRWPLPKRLPRVSIIIPTRDQAALLEVCLRSVTSTDYPNIELIVVDNDSVEPATAKVFKRYHKRIDQLIRHPGQFNFARINNQAASLASGEILCFLNNDIEALHTDWLSEMVAQLLRPHVGICGAKLLWPNDIVQHAGVTLGLHGLAGHQGNLWHDGDAGYEGYNQMVRQASAVTAACLLIRREDFFAVGGFDEAAFAVAFNDVDLCLKIRAQHKLVVWTPHARLRHHESVSRGNDTAPHQAARLEKEKAALRSRWGEVIMNDPYYNRNLSLKTFSHAALAFPPRQIPETPLATAS
jgi:GT2 family glycosyltransferase